MNLQRVRHRVLPSPLACDFYLNRIERHIPNRLTTVTPQEYQYSGFVPHSAQSSSDVPNEPTKSTQSRSATDKLATTNPRSAKAIRVNRRNLVVMRLASRRRSAVDKGVPTTVKMLIKMWCRTSRTSKLALNEFH
jgi:hypothetical protein